MAEYWTVIDGAVERVETQFTPVNGGMLPVDCEEGVVVYMLGLNIFSDFIQAYTAAMEDLVLQEREINLQLLEIKISKEKLRKQLGEELPTNSA